MKEKPIAFYAEIARELGSINAAIFYQQIRYWSDKGSREDGWIYKTAAEIEFETTLTEDKQRICKRILVDEKKWIEAKKIMFRGSLVWHYRLLVDFTFSMRPTGKIPVATSENPSSTTPQNPSSSITENTSETTQSEQSSLPAGVTTGDKYQPDHHSPLDVQRAKPRRTASDKQRYQITLMKLMDHFRDRVFEEHRLSYLSRQEDRNSKIKKQVESAYSRFGEETKDLIEWWIAGGGEWANYEPEACFTPRVYREYENRAELAVIGGKSKKKGKEVIEG